MFGIGGKPPRLGAGTPGRAAGRPAPSLVPLVVHAQRPSFRREGTSLIPASYYRQPVSPVLSTFPGILSFHLDLMDAHQADRAGLVARMRLGGACSQKLAFNPDQLAAGHARQGAGSNKSYRVGFLF